MEKTNSELNSLENRVFRVILFFIVGLSSINIVSNTIIGFNQIVNLKWAILDIFSFFLIYKERFNKYSIAKLRFYYFFVVVFIFLPLGWFQSGGSKNNGLAYVFLILTVISILFKDKRLRNTLVTILILMFILVISLEYKLPQLLTNYSASYQFHDRLIQIPLLLLANYYLLQKFAMAYEEEKEKLNHYSSELKKANDKLKYLASRDTLTKLYNRRAFDQEIKSIFINQSHRGKAISLILFDIDDFKSINDNYGHDIGDQVIIRLAELLKLDMPANSFISRWGGDEFAIIYSADLVKAEFYIKNLIYRIKILQSDELPFITISAGITELKSTDNIKSLFKRADNILYEAKESGKNNYILA